MIQIKVDGEDKDFEDFVSQAWKFPDKINVSKKKMNKYLNTFSLLGVPFPIMEFSEKEELFLDLSEVLAKSVYRMLYSQRNNIEFFHSLNTFLKYNSIANNTEEIFSKIKKQIEEYNLAEWDKYTSKTST